METKKIDYNSIENMRIKKKLVAREVLHICRSMIDELSGTEFREEIDHKFYSVYDEETGSSIEPLEFWIVTEWLGEKLKDHGEIVDELFDFTIWARTTSGQAIALDYVISKIAEEMEILDGQEYSWSDRK